MLATLQRALGDAYRLDRELGGGGMSRVFVAHDLTLDRDVVVKVLSEESTAGVSGDRFRREIQVIAKLQHPHVVSILSAGVADGSLYYVMPFVSGETLRARITREGPLPIADVVRLLREVLDALAFAHEHGVVHRDIKPENVLIGAGHAVVADFGIAKALREAGTMTSAGFAVGTPAYMAPEQATADPTTDHRADLYAVGVLGYELLTGAPPFEGTAQQVITAHITTPAPAIRARRTDVPNALADVITRALAKEPGARPQSALEMLAALEHVTTPAASVAGTPVPATPGGARSHWPLVATAALLLIVAAGAMAWSRMRTPSSTVADGADLIAVMPLSAVSDSSLTRLGQDLVVTLSTNLDGVGSLHTLDAMTMLMRVRKMASPLALTDARMLARELGARSVLTGTLINEGDRVRASVTLYRVGSDSAIARASALAAPRDIAALTDSLTWGVLQQVWRRGTPPSPVLSGLTTKSFDALRAFLDGERHFQRLEVDTALADYRRAFELDSNFVQAFLRHDYVNDWSLKPQDKFVHGRLLALKDKLPERERLWFETNEERLPIPARIAKWKALAVRYPDYPPVLMATADPIVHSGPLYGIPIAEARPYLERLDQLVPDHADTKFHLAVVTAASGSAEASAASMATASRIMGKPWGPVLGWMGALFEAQAKGKPMPPMDTAFAVGRLIAVEATKQPAFAVLAGLMGLPGPATGYRLDALDRIRKAGIYSGDVELQSTLGEGMLRASRGDWTGALRALRRTESANMPFAGRMTGARTAVMGAWLGAVDSVMADSVLHRVSSMPAGDSLAADRIEIRWLDGLQGITLGDEPRMQRARRDLLADTSTAAQYSARSLSGLWMTRINAKGAADTLKAVSDATMQKGGFLLSVEAIDRLVVARALRQRGAPGDAERYLMWPDAAINTVRSMTVLGALKPLVDYERGVSLDDAGSRTLAAYHLRRFLTAYDQPPAGHRGLIDDAKKRLAQLGASDAAPRPKTVPRP